MGASLGRSRCPHVSATLGGYISISGRIYILSVDHFLSECLCDNSNRLRSPSISDIANVEEEIQKKLKELGLKISRSAPNEVPLEQVGEILFHNRDVDEEVEQYRRFQGELNDKDDFALGVIRHRCGGVMPSRRLSADPRLHGVYHRMDWSISEVTAKHRQGKNLFRHGRVAQPGVEDFENEVMSPEGCGVPCTTIGDASLGERVYYVGTTSGLREGVINPALIQWRDENGDISHEWSIVVPRCELLKDSDFKGDSGAWIINNDNVLLGLLWGWDNGSILFTPIKDVFADITQKMNCDQIKLPEYSFGPRPERSGSFLCRTSSSITRESTPELIEHEELTGPARITSDLLSPIQILEGMHRRNSNASITSINSGSSTPSLLSSASSICDELILPPSSPQTPSSILVNGLSIRTKAIDFDWIQIDHEKTGRHET